MSDNGEDYDDFSVSPEIPITPVRYKDLSTSSNDANLITPGQYHDAWNQKRKQITMCHTIKHRNQIKMK